MKRIALPLLALIGLPLASVRDASACSIASCQPPVRLFQPDQQIAANLIRFKVTAADPGPLELRAADGTTVPARISMMGPDRVFAPDVPPAPEQKLTLHYRPVCAPSRPDAPPHPTEATFSFFVAPAGEMNLGPTSLTMTEKGIGYDGDGRSLIVRYHHLLPDRAGHGVHLVDTTWTIAGRPYAHYWFTDAVVSYCRPLRADWLQTSCGNYAHVPPGKHLLRAVSRLVGVDREFVAELEVDTSCDQVLRIDPAAPSDGGVPDAGDPRLDAGVPDAPIEVRPAEGSGVPPSADAAACAVSGLGGRNRAQAAGGALALLLVALGWVARRRPRRSRP